ncbi:MAG: SANT/Myb-like DNA-binding domain-containing protein [Candidatus Gastranaerophilaceae bacterium]|jgi:hypothetical protein
MTYESWTEKEIEILKKYYPLESWDKIEKLLPNRTRRSIIYKAYKLKIERRLLWSKEEEQILKKYYPSDISNDKLLNMLSKHTFAAIKRKAKLQGLKRGFYRPSNKESTVRRWTEKEIEILKNYYNKIPVKELVTLLSDRSTYAIYCVARDLKLELNEMNKNVLGKNQRWSYNEDESLINNFHILPSKSLMKLIPDRTLNAIKKRAQVLGLKRGKNTWASHERFMPWHDNEIEILRQNYQQCNIDKLLELLPHRSKAGTLKKVKQLYQFAVNEVKTPCHCERLTGAR